MNLSHLIIEFFFFFLCLYFIPVSFAAVIATFASHSLPPSIKTHFSPSLFYLCSSEAIGGPHILTRSHFSLNLARYSDGRLASCNRICYDGLREMKLERKYCEG